MRRAGLAAVGACMLLAACGGSSDDSTDTVEMADTADTVPTTTVAPTTTTLAETSTTVASTTTMSTTTTTVAPTTTLSPEQEAIAAAEEAVVNAFEARTAALVDPSNPELRDDLANYWTESAVPTLLAQLDDFVENSKVLVINDDPAAFFVILDGAVQVAPDRIEVPFCRLDSNIIVVRLEGIDAVLNDSVQTEIWRAVAAAVDGGWKIEGAEVLTDAGGEVECAALL